jgi:hypothetical protein
MMTKLRTICATVLLALALCAPAFAGDGQMGTGGPGPKPGQMGTGEPLATQAEPTDEESTATFDDLLLAAELAIWQSIIGQL